MTETTPQFPDVNPSPLRQQWERHYKFQGDGYVVTITLDWDDVQRLVVRALKNQTHRSQGGPVRVRARREVNHAS